MGESRKFPKSFFEIYGMSLQSGYMTMVSKVIAFGMTALLLCFFVAVALAEESPLNWARSDTDGWCRPSKMIPGTPPTKDGYDPANRPADANVVKHANGDKDWLIARYHWDDGQRDLGLEIWCIKGDPSYFSSRISQSKKGVGSTVVATPNGGGGLVATGPC